MSTAATTTTSNSIRLPSIHELTGKSNKEFHNHYQSSAHALTSPRSFVDTTGQPPVLSSLSINTNINDTTTFKIPPIKPMTPSSVAVNNSTNSTPTAPVPNGSILSKPVSLGSPAINYYDKQQTLLPRQEPVITQAGGVSATAAIAAPQSATTTSTISSPTFHLQSTQKQPHHHYHHQPQAPPPPPSYHSPKEYYGGHGSPQYCQPSRSYSAPVSQYLPHHASFYSQSHYTVQHPNNHGLQMGQPYTIAEVVPKTTNKCHRCGTTETPEWRRGPKGVRTLCNACGLFHAKLVKRKGAAIAAEEVLNNRVTKGKNGRRISTRKLLGNVPNVHHQRGERAGPLQGLQQHLQHYPGQFAVLSLQNHSTSPLQQPPLPSSSTQAYLLHHQQHQLPPPPNSSYVPQGYMALPPPAMSLNASVHYDSQVPTMPLVHH